MLKESIKGCTTIFFLIFIGYFIINIFPSIVNSYNVKNSLLSNLKDGNIYLNKKRESIIKKTNNNIEDYVFNDTDMSIDRLRNNLLKKSYEYQENSENAKNVIKKYTDIDIGEISEKIFSIENYKLKGNK